MVSGPAFAIFCLKTRSELVQFLTYSCLFLTRGTNSVKNMVLDAALGPGLGGGGPEGEFLPKNRVESGPGQFVKNRHVRPARLGPATRNIPE